MAETDTEPITNGTGPLSTEEEDERLKQRPADIDADVREMERRKRVEALMSSKLFREELERVLDQQMHEGNDAPLLQRIREMVGGRLHTGSLRGPSCVLPINDIRGIEGVGYEKGEKILRCKLAAVYRLVDLFGWTQTGITGQITARLNTAVESVLTTPRGLLPHEVTASSLVKVDMQGAVQDQGTTNFPVNVEGFSLHASVHAARPDVRCVLHVRSPSALAVSAMRRGLLPLCNEAALLGDVAYHRVPNGILDNEERDKLVRALGPSAKVLMLTSGGALCCGATLEEAFHQARHLTAACDVQLRLASLPLDELCLIDEDTRKQIYESSRKPPSDTAKWRVGGEEFEALMRMLDNAGFRTGYIYRNPLVKNDVPRPKNDVEVPPAVSSLGYLLEEEELYKQGIWKKGTGTKGERTRWLNSPNVYQKVEILETGTPDPKKITKWVDANNEEWVQDGSPAHSSTPVKIDTLQFVPKNTNPKEFKQLQQQIKEYRRADKISAGPQSHILEGVTWDEASKLVGEDAANTHTGDHVVLMGAASKGIIQRGYQHNATMYSAPYARNPFDHVTDTELDEYKRAVENKRRGNDYDTDLSESEAISAAQITSPASAPSETEEESRDEHRVLRIETKQAPVRSQPEVVLSDVDTTDFLIAERAHADLSRGLPLDPNLLSESEAFVDSSASVTSPGPIVVRVQHGVPRETGRDPNLLSDDEVFYDSPVSPVTSSVMSPIPSDVTSPTPVVVRVQHGVIQHGFARGKEEATKEAINVNNTSVHDYSRTKNFDNIVKVYGTEKKHRKCKVNLNFKYNGKNNTNYGNDKAFKDFSHDNVKTELINPVQNTKILVNNNNLKSNLSDNNSKLSTRLNYENFTLDVAQNKSKFRDDSSLNSKVTKLHLELDNSNDVTAAKEVIVKEIKYCVCNDDNSKPITSKIKLAQNDLDQKEDTSRRSSLQSIPSIEWDGVSKFEYNFRTRSLPRKSSNSNKLYRTYSHGGFINSQIHNPKPFHFHLPRCKSCGAENNSYVWELSKSDTPRHSEKITPVYYSADNIPLKCDEEFRNKKFELVKVKTSEVPVFKIIKDDEFVDSQEFSEDNYLDDGNSYSSEKRTVVENIEIKTADINYAPNAEIVQAKKLNSIVAVKKIDTLVNNLGDVPIEKDSDYNTDNLNISQDNIQKINPSIEGGIDRSLESTDGEYHSFIDLEECYESPVKKLVEKDIRDYSVPINCYCDDYKNESPKKSHKLIANILEPILEESKSSYSDESVTQVEAKNKESGSLFTDNKYSDEPVNVIEIGHDADDDTRKYLDAFSSNENFSVINYKVTENIKSCEENDNLKDILEGKIVTPGFNIASNADLATKVICDKTVTKIGTPRQQNRLFKTAEDDPVSYLILTDIIDKAIIISDLKTELTGNGTKVTADMLKSECLNKDNYFVTDENSDGFSIDLEVNNNTVPVQTALELYEDNATENHQHKFVDSVYENVVNILYDQVVIKNDTDVRNIKPSDNLGRNVFNPVADLEKPQNSRIIKLNPVIDHANNGNKEISFVMPLPCFSDFSSNTEIMSCDSTTEFEKYEAVTDIMLTLLNRVSLELTQKIKKSNYEVSSNAEIRSFDSTVEFEKYEIATDILVSIINQINIVSDVLDFNNYKYHNFDRGVLFETQQDLDYFNIKESAKKPNKATKLADPYEVDGEKKNHDNTTDNVSQKGIIHDNTEVTVKQTDLRDDNPLIDTKHEIPDTFSMLELIRDLEKNVYLSDTIITESSDNDISVLNKIIEGVIYYIFDRAVYIATSKQKVKRDKKVVTVVDSADIMFTAFDLWNTSLEERPNNTKYIITNDNKAVPCEVQCNKNDSQDESNTLLTENVTKFENGVYVSEYCNNPDANINVVKAKDRLELTKEIRQETNLKLTDTLSDFSQGNHSNYNNPSENAYTELVNVDLNKAKVRFVDVNNEVRSECVDRIITVNCSTTCTQCNSFDLTQDVTFNENLFQNVFIDSTDDMNTAFVDYSNAFSRCSSPYREGVRDLDVCGESPIKKSASLSDDTFYSTNNSSGTSILGNKTVKANESEDTAFKNIDEDIKCINITNTCCAETEKFNNNKSPVKCYDNKHVKYTEKNVVNDYNITLIKQTQNCIVNDTDFYLITHDDMNLDKIMHLEIPNKDAKIPFTYLRKQRQTALAGNKGSKHTFKDSDHRLINKKSKRGKGNTSAYLNLKCRHNKHNEPCKNHDNKLNIIEDINSPFLRKAPVISMNQTEHSGGVKYWLSFDNSMVDNLERSNQRKTKVKCIDDTLPSFVALDIDDSFQGYLKLNARKEKNCDFEQKFGFKYERSDANETSKMAVDNVNTISSDGSDNKHVNFVLYSLSDEVGDALDEVTEFNLCENNTNSEVKAPVFDRNFRDIGSTNRPLLANFKAPNNFDNTNKEDDNFTNFYPTEKSRRKSVLIDIAPTTSKDFENIEFNNNAELEESKLYGLHRKETKRLYSSWPPYEHTLFYKIISKFRMSESFDPSELDDARFDFSL